MNVCRAELGDYIYLILMIGIAVFSIIKKATEKNEPIPEYEEEPDFQIPQHKRDFVEHRVENSVPEKIIPSEVKNAKSFIKSSVRTEKRAPIEVVEDDDTIDFDIRQAIIYSEILKRPEY